jgi:hypothetical protein
VTPFNPYAIVVSKDMIDAPALANSKQSSERESRETTMDTSAMGHDKSENANRNRCNISVKQPQKPTVLPLIIGEVNNPRRVKDQYGI